MDLLSEVPWIHAYTYAISYVFDQSSFLQFFFWYFAQWQRYRKIEVAVVNFLGKFLIALKIVFFRVFRRFCDFARSYLKWKTLQFCFFIRTSYRGKFSFTSYRPNTLVQLDCEILWSSILQEAIHHWFFAWKYSPKKGSIWN